MNLMRQLAHFVVEADVATLPSLDRDILRRHACDTMVARVLGGLSEEGLRLRKVFAGTGSEGIAGIAALVRMTEMDDIHTGANVTPSSVTVPTAFCLYPSSDRDPRRLENAIYVGTELLVRFAMGMDGARALFLGFWPTRSGATLGACATACRILGLTIDQTEQALSLAVMTSAGRSGRFLREPSGRWIVFANAVATGLRMAYAAREGFNGAANSPDGAWISAALGLEFDAAELTTGLGTRSVFPDMSLKPYATARQALGATEAMRDLMRDGLDPTRVQRVIVRVPTSHRGMIAQSLDPRARGTAFVSGACQVATAALMPDALYDIERRDVLENHAIAAFASRVEIVGDPTLDHDFPRIWAARVDAVTPEGTVSRFIENAPGSPGARLTEADLHEKALRALGFFGQAARADELIGLAPTLFTNEASAAEAARVFLNG